MDALVWGIIGCGDVTEVKSGPAFNKVANSSIGAVMRRDAAKAADYASRHGVKKWYADADALINDPDINAIYIATPPSSHEEYTIAALKAGKPVYVEKPMAPDVAACRRMKDAAETSGVKLSVAHYRRFLPLYVKLKELLDAGALGDIRFVNLKICQPAPPKTLANSSSNWRINPAVSGGGIFHDLAPHQIDILLQLFGEVDTVDGYSRNQSGDSDADDIVSGRIVFSNGVVFSGLWCFNVSAEAAMDDCEIVGSKGFVKFGFFTTPEMVVNIQGREERMKFQYPAHVQQLMIEQVVSYFLGRSENPCSAEEGVKVAEVMEAFTKR